MSKSKTNKRMMVEEYETLRLNMKSEGYAESVCTVSIAKANVMAILLSLPIIFVCVSIYLLRWWPVRSMQTDAQVTETALFRDIVVFLLLMVVCLVAHEGIHGVTWRFFCKEGWKSIHFGVMWSSLTPYCHCKEELRFGGYVLGCIMPLLVLGIGLYIVSLFASSAIILFLSIMNILGAGGDMFIALKLRKYKKSLIFDHPTACGFTAFTK